MPNEYEETLNVVETSSSDIDRVSLGLTPIPAGTFEHDVSVSEKYQAFSRELLRLALAGIGAIGLIIFSQSDSRNIDWLIKHSSFGFMISFSALSFAIAAILSLLHQYFGSDAKSFHLRFIRMQIALGGVENTSASKEIKGFTDFFDRRHDKTQGKSLSEKASNERAFRDYLLRLSGRLLFWAGTFLGIGAVFFVFSIIVMVVNKAQ